METFELIDEAPIPGLRLTFTFALIVALQFFLGAGAAARCDYHCGGVVCRSYIPCALAIGLQRATSTPGCRP